MAAIHLDAALDLNQHTGLHLRKIGPPRPLVMEAVFSFQVRPLDVFPELSLPRFDFYRDDLAVLEGSKTLAGIKSVNTISQAKSDKALNGNDSVEAPSVISCSPKKKTVKEWAGE